MTKRRIWQIIRNVIIILAALVAGFFFSSFPGSFQALGPGAVFIIPTQTMGRRPFRMA